MEAVVKAIYHLLEDNIVIWNLMQICKKEYHGYLRQYRAAKQVEPGLHFVWNYIKWFYVLVIYGASAEDYFVYQFYKKSMYEINTFITRRRRFWFTKKLNKGTNREPVEDKALFADIFSDFTNRVILDGNQITYAEFKALLQEKKKLIVKPRDGYDGKNIFLVKDSDNEDGMRRAYDNIYGKNYVIEEIVEQTGILHDLNPETVNTLRVNVLHWDEECFVVNAFLRVGSGDGCVDNFHSGGISAAIDMSSGVVSHWAAALDMRRYMFHPETGKQVIGIVIPRWSEVIETAKKAALIIGDVPYTSWDIVSSEDKVTIIEGNTWGDATLQQVSDQLGKWDIYKNFTKRVLMERKRMRKNADSIKR